MTPRQYQKIKNLLDDLIQKIACSKEVARKKAHQCPPPTHLRPAKPEDIFVGNIIWYPKCENRANAFWKEVGEVLKPNDEFKAYYSDDGCRYGLDGAFVEYNGGEAYSSRDPEQQSHQKRHIMLHNYLDELAADFLSHTNNLLTEATIMDLFQWSKEQTRCPTEV